MEWISVEESLPDVPGGKFKVKRANSDEIKAYYYKDKGAWLTYYFRYTPTHWWTKEEPIYDVTHWSKKCQK